ncbi:MAG TPA: BatD family protein [Bacteroidales bacterium]|nr:BatD family protein [Bacteroidales bacterium]HRU57468.1 BatD family protein [Bacteroidales bacterium]
MRRLIIKYLFILIVPSVAVAQEIVIKTEYPRVVSVGEQFSISWTINAGGGEFSAPPFTGFYKLMGPQTSYSSSMQIINGRISQETSYTYTYYLQAIEEGKFVIPPALIRVKGKEYRSDSIYIEVVGTPGARQMQPSASRKQATEPAAVEPSGELFVRLIPNRTELYVGEPLTLSLKLFTRVDLAGLEEVKYPDFSGFVKEELETPQLTSLQRENVNGLIYGTGIIQQFLLFPQITGEITIDPVQVTALVQQRIGEPDPFFGDFFSRFANVPRVLATLPLKITVKPLPENKPADFSGIVGKISISASLNKDTVKVNDALNFKITVSGTGNLRLAAKPVIKLSPDIEIYDPKITDNLRNSTSGITGQRTYEYVLIPRHHGDFVIPSVTYSYFNPATKQFETATTKEFRFHALKTDEQSGEVTVFGGVTREDVKYLGKDIRFIKSLPGIIIIPEKLLLSNRMFTWYYVLALLIFATVLILRREHVRRNADIARVRNRRAGKVAKKRLSVAYKCLKSGMKEKFYEELLKALWGYMSDKLGIPLSELTRTKAVEKLKERNVDDQIIEKISSIIDRCEYARFAPVSAPSEAEELYEGAAQFIRYIENKLD